MKRVAITGLAIASPFGSTLESFWRGLCVGPVPLAEWSSPGFPELARPIARLPKGEFPDMFDPAVHAPTVVATELVRRALASARLGPSDLSGVGLSLGSMFGETDSLRRPPAPTPPPMLATVARSVGLRGPVANTPVGCATGNVALGWALDAVREGYAKAMVAGGVDLIGTFAVGMFGLLFGNLTDTCARPFSADRDGVLLGEGGAMFVLEPLDEALRDGKRVLAELCSAASSHDAFHPTQPASDGRGVRLAIERALREASLAPRDIGYVNAHSPGTEANDPGEARALRDVFGPRGVPVSSTKAALGHAQGGANALEAVACVLALERQLLPPTLNTVAVPDEYELDVVLGAPRRQAVTHALSTGSGMGGGNGVIVLGRGQP